MKISCQGVIYDLSRMSEVERTDKFREWHELRESIKELSIVCYCNEMAKIFPPMHVRKRGTTYFLANNGSINKSREIHDSSCPYNNTYREKLSTIGIKYDEEKDMFSVNLSTKRNMASNSPNSITSSYRTAPRSTRNLAIATPVNRLYYLFLAMLEFRQVEKYCPDGFRNLVGRIWSAASHVKINRRLLKDMLYVAETKEKKSKQTNSTNSCMGK